MNAQAEFRRDRQFLPAALEVIETPSSPRRRALLWTLCAFIGFALAWSFVGRVDIEAVAKGKIEPRGRVKVIEPLEPGRVSKVFVRDGDLVRKDDALVEFDAAEMRADEEGARAALAVDVAETARYRAALAAAGDAGTIDPHPMIDWDDMIPAALRTREAAAVAADLVQLADALRNLDMRGAERRSTRDKLDAGMAADERLVATLQTRVDMRQTLASHDNGTKASVIDAMQDLERAQSGLIADRGARAETAAALDTIDSDKAKTVSQFITDDTTKLNESANKALADRQTFAKALSRSGRTTLRSPVDGVVQKLSVTTLGQVASQGQELMTIVPSGDTLDIEAFIDNGDIGFVKPGQEVVVKLDAFPFTRYGTLEGRVASVATDAIDEGEARRLSANATSLVNSSSMAGANDGQGQRFVFPIQVSLLKGVFRVVDRDVPLTAGMSVTAEIKTDRQRIIDYVLSPLAQMTSEALHER